MPIDGTDSSQRVSLKALLGVFGLIGITSLGGGLSGWMHREVVERRHWLTAQEFLTGLSLARTLPGINVINLAIWIGYQLRRGKGALIAACAVLAGPMLIIVLVATCFRHWGQAVLVHEILVGVVAAALGLSASLGFKSLRAAIPSPLYAGVVLVLFVGIGMLHWPLIPVVTAVGSISIAASFFTAGADEK